MNGIRFLKLEGPTSGLLPGRLPDEAFSIPNYILNFPHIFEPASSAQIFAGMDESGEIVAMCAADTEFWSEPVPLRGACIGSVAVHPRLQKRGIGRGLLSWATDYLRSLRLHDFIYLYSDQPHFYESLGFRRCGTERLYTLRVPSLSPADGNFKFHRPVFASQLSDGQKMSLWHALERGRLKGESHAQWWKFCEVLKIPDMLVSWVGDPRDNILAGAFIGKGVDFKSVIHTFFAFDDSALQSFWGSLRNLIDETGVDLLAAPGLWASRLAGQLTESVSQPLCLVLANSNHLPDAGVLIDAQKIYPRALFSS
jgi:GNAT superfamily N-acetyltransferase